MSHLRRPGAVAKQKWTEEEEAALRAGVEKYEAGKWRYIQKDPELGPILKNRSNVDLKDKWRNLNMDSGGSRRESRASADKAAKRRRKRRSEKTPDSAAEDEDAEAEIVAARVHASGKRRRIPVRRYDEEPESSNPEPEQLQPQAKEVAEGNILAAMIQLQSPEGALADTICEWLEDNYNVSASGKRSVKWTLKQMMEAGKMTCEAGYYKLAGFPQQLLEDSKRWAGEEDAVPYSWEAVSNRTAREAAEAAAKAVQEAEQAAELATELIAAADRFDRETDEAVEQDNNDTRQQE